MTISIRERKLKNERSRLILDYYSEGKRWVEKLDLFITDKPKTKQERDSFNPRSLVKFTGCNYCKRQSKTLI